MLRLVEYDGKKVDAEVTLDPSLMSGFKTALAVDLLERPDKGKVTLRYRGREITHQDIGMRLLERIRDELAEDAGDAQRLMDEMVASAADLPHGESEFDFAGLATALNAGQIDTLVILGSNPALTAPADLQWAAAQGKAKEVVLVGAAAVEQDHHRGGACSRGPGAQHLM